MWFFGLVLVFPHSPRGLCSKNLHYVKSEERLCLLFFFVVVVVHFVIIIITIIILLNKGHRQRLRPAALGVLRPSLLCHHHPPTLPSDAHCPAFPLFQLGRPVCACQCVTPG